MTALDTFDFWVATFMIYTLAMFQTIAYGWMFGIERGEQELHEGAHIRVPRLVQYVLKYVSPVYLIVIFAAFCWQSLPGRIEGMKENHVVLASVCFIATVFAFLIVLVRIAGKRWEREGRLRYK
jgi:neurotransmitter:Na+ symporter, NSS family